MYTTTRTETEAIDGAVTASKTAKILCIVGGSIGALVYLLTFLEIGSAILLPSFQDRAVKARESEAKQYVGAVNRAQQSDEDRRVGFQSG